MDMNLGMYSNLHINDIENENIENSNDINIFLRIERNILDNVLGTLSVR